MITLEKVKIDIQKPTNTTKLVVTGTVKNNQKRYVKPRRCITEGQQIMPGCDENTQTATVEIY